MTKELRQLHRIMYGIFVKATIGHAESTQGRNDAPAGEKVVTADGITHGGATEDVDIDAVCGGNVGEQGLGLQFAGLVNLIGGQAAAVV